MPFHYLRDWCISRQLWWGHRIPAYYVTIRRNGSESKSDDVDRWVCAHSEKEAIAKAVKKFGVSEEEITVERGIYFFDAYSIYCSKKCFFFNPSYTFILLSFKLLTVIEANQK